MKTIELVFFIPSSERVADFDFGRLPIHRTRSRSSSSLKFSDTCIENVAIRPGTGGLDATDGTEETSGNTIDPGPSLPA